jgi:hypothetical protein
LGIEKTTPSSVPQWKNPVVILAENPGNYIGVKSTGTQLISFTQMASIPYFIDISSTSM